MMINGSAAAPFQHDSTWPEEVQTGFRSAVYYYHVQNPGYPSINHLRELTGWVLKEGPPRKTLDQWKCLRKVCNEVVHINTEGVDNGDMGVLVKNLLVIANMLLIENYGLQPKSSLMFVDSDPVKEQRHKAGRENAWRAYLEKIGEAVKNLEEAIEEWRQGRNHTPRRLKLEKGSAVLCSIPSMHPLISAEDSRDVKLVWKMQGSGKCRYEFRPDEPIGWAMVAGNSANDRFADDEMASPGVFGDGPGSK